jgi:hypothetical protein
MRLSAPLPLGFSQVLILKLVKVLCFDTLLQVLILKEVRLAMNTALGEDASDGVVRLGTADSRTHGCGR